MSKVLDWDSVPSNKFINKSESKLKAAMQRAHNRDVSQAENTLSNPMVREVIKKSLMNKLVKREELLVLKGFQYHCQELQKSAFGSRFVDTVKVIPSGARLTFEQFETSTNTLLFKATMPDNSTQEVEIYGSEKVVGTNGMPMDNMGFMGLMYNTSVTKEVLASMNKGE